MFIGSTVLCYAYAAYVILCAIALSSLVYYIDICDADASTSDAHAALLFLLVLAMSTDAHVCSFALVFFLCTQIIYYFRFVNIAEISFISEPFS